jgi:hypothetical protein
MMRTEESGGFQGAISSMLSVADICPSCGKLLGEHHRKILLATTARCPDSVFGAFPYIEGGPIPSPFSDDGPSSSSTSPTGRFTTPPRETAAGVFATPAPEGRLFRRQELLTMVWSLGGSAEEFP